MKLRIAKIQQPYQIGSREVIEYWDEYVERWFPLDVWEFFSEEERMEYNYIKDEEDFLEQRQRDLGLS